MEPHIPTTGPGPRRAGRQFRVRTMMLAVGVAALWFVVLRVPGVARLLGIVAGLVGLGLAVGLGGMALGWLGFGLVALVEQGMGWAGRRSRWPDVGEDGRP